jgi:hypothetical protein
MYPNKEKLMIAYHTKISEDWRHVRERASLKAFTTVKNMIANGHLRYDDRTSLSDDEWDDQSS